MIKLKLCTPKCQFDVCIITFVQVNLIQKHLSLHQLSHKMTKDCSWNYHKNYKRRTWEEHGQNMHVLSMFCISSFYGNSTNSLLSYCGLIDAKIRAFDKDLLVQH